MSKNDLDLDNYVNCSICFEKYGSSRLPRTLPCGHSFCSDCVERFTFCPRCMETFDPRAVQTNYQMLAAIRAIEEQRMGQSASSTLEFKKPAPTYPLVPTSIGILNVHPNLKKEELLIAFSRFGAIKRSAIYKTKGGNTAAIEFETSDAAQAAWRNDAVDLCGQRVEIHMKRLFEEVIFKTHLEWQPRDLFVGRGKQDRSAIEEELHITVSTQSSQTGGTWLIILGMPEDVENSKPRILDIANRSKPTNTTSTSEPVQAQQKGSQSSFPEMEKEIAVHNDKIGFVIGKKGAMVNKLKETTKANIVLLNEEIGNNMKKFRISGDRVAVNAAEEEIRKIIRNSESITSADQSINGQKAQPPSPTVTSEKEILITDVECCRLTKVQRTQISKLHQVGITVSVTPAGTPSGHKLVRISGERDAVKSAEEEIRKTINTQNITDLGDKKAAQKAKDIETVPTVEKEFWLEELDCQRLDKDQRGQICKNRNVRILLKTAPESLVDGHRQIRVTGVQRAAVDEAYNDIVNIVGRMAIKSRPQNTTSQAPKKQPNKPQAAKAKAAPAQKPKGGTPRAAAAPPPQPRPPSSPSPRPQQSMPTPLMQAFAVPPPSFATPQPQSQIPEFPLMQLPTGAFQKEIFASSLACMAISGPNGANAVDIRNRTGANILVIENPNEWRMGLKPVRITGQRDEVERALIEVRRIIG